MSPIWYIGVLVMAGSALGAMLLRRFSHRRRLYDYPNERSGHAAPIPRIGGISIALASTGGWLAAVAAGMTATPQFGLVVTSALLMSIVGLLDDVRSLHPGVKFTGQVLAVAVMVAAWLGDSPPWWFVLIAAGWLLTYTNQFNFMDGSDGLAAGGAAIQGASLAALAAVSNRPDIWAVAVLLSAAALGFLVVNYPPASIFMGDTGSHFLGFSLGVIGVLVWRAGIGPVLILAALSPFITDTTFTLARRAVNGDVLFLAHRSHLYQRLLQAGWTPKAVAWAYYLWCIWAGVSAWWAAQWGAPLWTGIALLVIDAVPVAIFLPIVRRPHDSRKALVSG